MRIYKKPTRLALASAVLAFSLSAGGAMAFDPEKEFKPDEEPRNILRYGFDALKRGNMEEAIGAFRFGAKRNDVAAQWKLARMLQKGSGLPRDDLAAYELYSKISVRYAERAPSMNDMAYVSSAVVALGRYSLYGIKDTKIRPNPRRAEGYFFRAAALYKDPSAQYELGRMYRSDVLGVKQPRTAVRWFGLAAKKGHVRAQAQLGEMLFYGEGVRRRPVRGLVFMTKAATRSARKSLKSIRKMRQKAFAKASDAQRKAANKIIIALKLKPLDNGQSFALENRTVGAAASSASQEE